MHKPYSKFIIVRQLQRQRNFKAIAANNFFFAVFLCNISYIIFIISTLNKNIFHICLYLKFRKQQKFLETLIIILFPFAVNYPVFKVFEINCKK